MRSRRSLPSLLILGVLLALIAPAPAAAADPDAAGAAKTKVLVTFARHPSRGDERSIKALGGKITRRFSIVDAVAVTVPRGSVRQLGRLAGVKRVEKDAALQLFDHDVPTGDLEWDNAWGVAHIGAPAVYNAGIRGAGVKVAVIDSGIDYVHDNPTSNPPVYPEFNGIYAGGHDFKNNDDDPYDDNGHGTHVSGIIAAAKNGYLVSGVAPEVKLYALKIVDQDGNGEYSDLIAALQWVYDYDVAHPGDGIDVINMSVGAHDVSDALHTAIQQVASQGVLMAAASGNVNPLDFNELINGCPVAFPGAYPEVLSTTFTQEQDALTGYSCTGPEVDFASPGDNILSTVPTGSCMFCSPTGYNWESGTSMASPHLAGLLALLVSAGLTDQGAPGLFDDARSAICSTADTGAGVVSLFGGITPIPTTDSRYAKYFGCGVINADGAVLGLNQPPPSNDPPVAVDDAATTAEDTAATIAVLTNDTDANHDTLTVSSVTNPAHGTAVKNADGTVRYTPAANYNGADTFDYVVSDGHGGTDTGSVAVTVTAVNDPPVAHDDTATTAYQTAVAIPVLTNDTDVEGDTLSVTAVGAASHGAVTIGPGGSVTYTPSAGYTGSDSFAYTAGDGHGGSSIGHVSVTVGAAPPPVNPFHVGDLDRQASKSRNTWTAKVTITVHTATHAALSGAVVTGTWSDGSVVTVKCTTASNGKCTVTSAKLASTVTSVTFTVTLVTKTGATYVASANHDPDNDSNGTTITVNRP